ncbi:MAG: hypothetical protein K9W43_06240 [Candidatus Thorarchaeota archaeon]|nr:hypothetical protein [Candidatus Thorarchaeota archaeon]
MIGDLQVEEASYDSPLFHELSADDRDIWAQQVGQQVSKSGEIEDGFRAVSDISILIISNALALLPSAFSIGGLTAVAVVLATALVTWEFWLFGLACGIGSGAISLDFALGIFAGWLDSFFGYGGLIVSTIIKSAIMYYIVNKVYTSCQNLAYFKTWLIWTILGVVVQFFMCVYSYYIFTVLLETSIQSYLDGAST